MNSNDVDLDDADIYASQLYKPHKNKRLSNTKTGYPVSQNIVCTYAVGTPMELSTLAAHNGVSVKTPDFSAATFRIANHGTIQAFGSEGNCVIVGCSSLAGVCLLSQIFRKMLNKQGIPATQGMILTRNRVCNGDVGFPIDVENFKSDTLGMVFDKKLFPGIVFFVNIENVVRVFLLFGSGNYIFMGLQENRDEQAHKVYEYILPILMKNRLGRPSESEHINSSIKRVRKRIISDMKKENSNLSRSCNQKEICSYLERVVREETMIVGENETQPEGRKRRSRTMAIKEEHSPEGAADDEEDNDDHFDIDQFAKLTKQQCIR